MTAREGRSGKRKDGRPKFGSMAAAREAYQEGMAKSRGRRWDVIERKAFERTPESAEFVTVRAQLATDMTNLADRGWTIKGMGNRGVYNLNTVWVMQIERATLEAKYGKGEAA